jgi:small subunit ribosomal protein S9
MATKSKKKKQTAIVVKAKKKRAVARAVIRPGRGTIRINKRNIEIVQPKYAKMLLEEPLMIAGEDVWKSYDIEINVQGGGFMGQIVSARAAIAKALCAATKDKKLKEAFIKYDRMLLVDDPRRVEPKKPLGPKARRKKQKSKR